MQDENQLLDERGFFERYAETLTVRQAGALGVLMDLSDYDLLDLHLARKTLEQVNPGLVRDDVAEIVSMLREIR